MAIKINATKDVTYCYIGNLCKLTDRDEEKVMSKALQGVNRTLKKILTWVLYFHLFLALVLVLTHCSVTKHAERSYEHARKEKPYDVIIVPGVPYNKAATTSVMTMRLYWAKHLYDSGFTKNIIFSGSSVYTHFVEGIAMKIMADSLGIPADNTFFETKAEHSTENIYYSWKMAREKGFQKIALATDPYQSALLRRFMRRYTPGVKNLPIVFSLLDIDDRSLPKIDTTSAFVSNFVPITKRQGFWERFQGTMGKRVKEDVKREKAIAREEMKKDKEALSRRELTKSNSVKE